MAHVDDGRWVDIAPGVHARRYTELDQSLGLVIGEERCLVIDTGRDEDHGAEFAAAIREITPLPWTVVITHAHFDHCLGTAAFVPCAVWAHERCTVDDRVFVERAGYYPGAGPVALRAPTHTFGDRVTLDLGGRSVRLLHLGRGHTDHDVIVHVPDAGVVFAGDLVEEGAPPSVGEDAFPGEWPAALAGVLALRPRVVVPGHGDPVDAAFVARQRAELARAPHPQ